MPVNLASPRPEDLLPVKGVMLGVAEAGVRKAHRRDLLVMRIAEGTRCRRRIYPEPLLPPR